MLPAPPAFASIEDYRERLGEAEFWRPYAVGVLERHGFGVPESLTMDSGSTFPVVLAGGQVIKLFGFGPCWRQAFETEKRVLDRLSTVDAVPAPDLLASGALGDDWRYLILRKVGGQPWVDVEGDRLDLADSLGRTLAQLHLLPTDDLPGHVTPTPDDWDMALEQSSLPAHLVEQVADFLDPEQPGRRAFVHSDLIGHHVFVDGDTISGIIDWGDAVASDRHYELAKLHLDLFACDKTLLAAFLDAADWSKRDFDPRRAMQLALLRQVECSKQHFSCDVFHRVTAAVPLEKIATLDDLAERLFAV